MDFEKQNRAGWKIGSTEDFLNNLEVSINKYLLITSKSEFLCFSPISNEYYLSTTKNSDVVFLASPQKEQETIKLYSDLMGVFLTPVLS